jgi:hypothetical protein
MNNFRKIIFSLLAIISFSLTTVGAQAGGINISIGGYGHGYFPSNYYGHNYKSYYGYTRNSSYGHNYKPYYGYRNHRRSYVNHNNYSSRYDSQRQHNRRDQHRSNNRNYNHGNSRIASNMSHR